MSHDIKKVRIRLLLGVEDTGGVKQSKTKRQKNEGKDDNKRLIKWYSIVTCPGSSASRWSQILLVMQCHYHMTSIVSRVTFNYCYKV